MTESIQGIFGDSIISNKIQRLLPNLFQMAELESSRAGKIGMEVGSLREKILIALLIYKFGDRNVETGIRITEPEIDVKIFGSPYSIKTISGKGFGGVKIIWTVDKDKALEFLRKYSPLCDMLLVRINWNSTGGFYHIPKEVQNDVFTAFGRERYIKLPKPGTNPRGVEISQDAMVEMLSDSRTNVIEITWEKTDIDFDPYKRWVDYWREEEQ